MQDEQDRQLARLGRGNRFGDRIETFSRKTQLLTENSLKDLLKHGLKRGQRLARQQLMDRPRLIVAPVSGSFPVRTRQNRRHVAITTLGRVGK